MDLPSINMPHRRIVPPFRSPTRIINSIISLIRPTTATHAVTLPITSTHPVRGLDCPSAELLCPRLGVWFVFCCLHTFVLYRWKDIGVSDAMLPSQRDELNAVQVGGRAVGHSRLTPIRGNRRVAQSLNPVSCLRSTPGHSSPRGAACGALLCIPEARRYDQVFIVLYVQWECESLCPI